MSRVNEVEDVPRRPERDPEREPAEGPHAIAGTAGEDHECDHGEREDRRELRLEREPEGDRAEEALRPRRAEQEVDRGDEHRRDDEVAHHRLPVEQHDRQGREDEARERGLAVREPRPSRQACGAQCSCAEGGERQERRVAVASAECEQRGRAHLGERWIDVEPELVPHVEVPDVALLDPERRTRQVVGQRIPVVRRERQAEDGDVGGGDPERAREDAGLRGGERVPCPCGDGPRAQVRIRGERPPGDEREHRRHGADDEQRRGVDPADERCRLDDRRERGPAGDVGGQQGPDRRGETGQRGDVPPDADQQHRADRDRERRHRPRL